MLPRPRQPCNAKASVPQGIPPAHVLSVEWHGHPVATRICCVAPALLLYVVAMEPDAVWGILIAGLALGLLVALVLVSRRRINRIAKRGYRSARQTIKEMGQ